MKSASEYVLRWLHHRACVRHTSTPVNKWDEEGRMERTRIQLTNYYGKQKDR